MAHQRAGHPVLITEYLDGRIAEQHFDIGSLHHAFLHRLRSTQVVFAYHHIHFVAQRRQIGRLFTGGIAAADYDDILFAVEKTVAGRAGRNTHALVTLFRSETEILSRRTGGDNQRIGFDLPPTVGNHLKRPYRKIHARDNAETHIGAETLGLLLQVFHHSRTADPLRITGKVLDIGSRGELASGFGPFV